MGSKTCSSLALLLTLNLLLFFVLGSGGPGGGSGTSCPLDAPKLLAACGNVLKGLVNVTSCQSPPAKPCCSLLNGLPDLEAAVCLCNALTVNIFGIKLHFPISLITSLLKACSKQLPRGFQCS